MRFTKFLCGVVLIAIFVDISGSLYILSDNHSANRLLQSIYHFHVIDKFEHVLFFMSVCLLFIVCRRQAGSGKDQQKQYWWTLASLFSIALLVKVLKLCDVFSRSLHGLDVRIGRHVSSTIAYALALSLVLGIGLYFSKFLVALRPRIRYTFIAGGVLYLLGVNSMWGIHEWILGKEECESCYHVICHLCEDSFEMFGLVVFINGLWAQLEDMATVRT